MSAQSVFTYNTNPSPSVQIDQQQFIANADLTSTDYASAIALEATIGFVGIVKTFTTTSQAGALASELSSCTKCTATFTSPRGSTLTLNRVKDHAHSANIKILNPYLTPFSKMKLSELRSVDTSHTVHRLEQHLKSIQTNAFVAPDIESVVPVTSSSWSTQLISLKEGQAHQMHFHGNPVIYIEYDSVNTDSGSVFAIFAFAAFEDFSDVDLALPTATDGTIATRIGGVIHTVVTLPVLVLSAFGVPSESWKPAVLVEGQKITTLDNSSELNPSLFAGIRYATQLIRRASMWKLLKSSENSSTPGIKSSQLRKSPTKRRKRIKRSVLSDK